MKKLKQEAKRDDAEAAYVVEGADKEPGDGT
jgi:hypothetical protein